MIRFITSTLFRLEDLVYTSTGEVNLRLDNNLFPDGDRELKADSLNLKRVYWLKSSFTRFLGWSLMVDLLILKARASLESIPADMV